MIRVVSRASASGFVVFVMLAIAAPKPAAAQRPAVPSDGRDLQGWKAEHAKVDVRDGVFLIEKGNGWVRTERAYADFVLSLDVRIPSGGEAAIFLRAWPTFGVTSRPSNAYRLRVPAVTTAAQSSEWQHLEVECSGGALKVRADGVLVKSAEDLGNPQGHIGLSAPDTAVEYKAISIREVRPPLQPVPGALALGAGIQSPKPLLTPSPRYTGDAIRARISGRVVMQAVVQPDGIVKDVRILQSLDPHFGLDEIAVETAQKWTFVPGTRDGQPVPVRITIELEFNLRP